MEEGEQLDVLGEQLYSIIYPKYSDIAGKLTGMLLELPASVIEEMLKDKRMLSDGIEKALCALQLSSSNSNSESTDSLGERLYNLIDLYNTGHSEKITGMLLEQKKEDMKKLFVDSKLLEENINVALKTLEQQNRIELETPISSEFDEKEKLGESLFAMIEEIDAENCADITGMLLEMDMCTLQKLQCDRVALETAVHRAQAALLSSPALDTAMESDLDSETETLGMLLELPKKLGVDLLNSPDRLNMKLEEAASVLEDI
ncbi:uncharacterized protein LOC121307481 isoform X2 [Polyodon spathula]|uniref:uncharacterized protein LOC121307481 isoform X2 n=1 Tax=Polyodon spathula TaxID=7913 RepID=UPI001B7E78C1|nr:uncharacterized protein LOC121307481 isoform X2 [Polyodon spathula]